MTIEDLLVFISHIVIPLGKHLILTTLFIVTMNRVISLLLWMRFIRLWFRNFQSSYCLTLS